MFSIFMLKVFHFQRGGVYNANSRFLIIPNLAFRKNIKRGNAIAYRHCLAAAVSAKMTYIYSHFSMT